MACQVSQPGSPSIGTPCYVRRQTLSSSCFGPSVNTRHRGRSDVRRELSRTRRRFGNWTQVSCPSTRSSLHLVLGDRSNRNGALLKGCFLERGSPGALPVGAHPEGAEDVRETSQELLGAVPPHTPTPSSFSDSRNTGISSCIPHCCRPLCFQVLYRRQLGAKCPTRGCLLRSQGSLSVTKLHL